MKNELTDLFDRSIKKGDSFMRIEDNIGGANLRYYFFAGFAADGRIMVMEYGGVPRIIKKPHCRLVKLDAGQMQAKHFVAPRVDYVIDKLKEKAKQ